MLAAVRKAVPFLDDMRSYRASTFRSDLIAAITVAIVVLPQSMAYAMIAGVDPIYGLYTAIVTAIVGSFFGSSNHLITGPTNALALMIAGAMKDHLGSADFYPLLFLLTFLVGAIQIGMGLLKVGKIVNLVSHSVIVGFTAGAGIIIGLGQLNEVLGIGLPKGYHPLYEKVLLTLGSLDRTNLYALGIAAMTVILMLGLKKINRRIPGALLALVLSGLLAKFMGAGDRGVKLVGLIPDHLPTLAMVHFDFAAVTHLFGAAIAIAIVGLVEAIAIAKSISLSSEQRIEPTREFIGQGLANVAGSFFGCFPASGSFTRSAINYSTGAQSRMAGILSGVLVAITLVGLVAYAQYIPMASLAGVIVLVAYSMVDQHAIRRIVNASRNDLWVMLITAGATVVMPDLERAILTGITVSVLVHVWNTGEIRVKLLKPHGASFREYDLEPGAQAHGTSDIAIVHLDGDLFFGSASDLQDKLRQVADHTAARVFILRLKRVNVVDVSAFEIVESFIEKTLARNGHVILCGVSPAMGRFVRRIGLARLIGEENIFPEEGTIYSSTNKAYERAEHLLAVQAGPGALPAGSANTTGSNNPPMQ
jgi:SulP family sulfate permease